MASTQHGRNSRQAQGLEHASFFSADGFDVDWALIDAIATAGTHVGAIEAMLSAGTVRNPAVFAKLEQRSRNFLRMHAAGVRLVCCSDSGAAPRKPHGVLPTGITHTSARSACPPPTPWPRQHR